MYTSIGDQCLLDGRSDGTFIVANSSGGMMCITVDSAAMWL